MATDETTLDQDDLEEDDPPRGIDWMKWFLLLLFSASFIGNVYQYVDQEQLRVESEELRQARAQELQRLDNTLVYYHKGYLQTLKNAEKHLTSKRGIVPNRDLYQAIDRNNFMAGQVSAILSLLETPITPKSGQKDAIKIPENLAIPLSSSYVFERPYANRANPKAELEFLKHLRSQIKNQVEDGRGIVKTKIGQVRTGGTGY